MGISVRTTFVGERKKSKHYRKKIDTVKKAGQQKKSDIAKILDTNLQKKHNFTNFPTKIKENVAFFMVRFFYQALFFRK